MDTDESVQATESSNSTPLQRGVFLYINERNEMNYKVVGGLSEAEVLGLGTWFSQLPLIQTIMESLKATMSVGQTLSGILEVMMAAKTEEGESECCSQGSSLES